MADDQDTIYRADGKPTYLWLNDGVLGAVKGYRTWVWQPGGPWVRYLFNPFTDGIVVTVQEAIDNLRAAYEGGGTQPSPFDDGSIPTGSVGNSVRTELPKPDEITAAVRQHVDTVSRHDPEDGAAYKPPEEFPPYNDPVADEDDGIGDHGYG